ncbi:putative RNA polymerase I specific transcription initiation factor RRN3, armadillo-like helical [Lupinus albus]|uniref:Putative RNA polymerase I specific transcription initiation factor RRN3, armadillo-like helical n=1 Tax=Lupinus albus TaxID=3870 RepID=A0A6A4QM33_LUPAL|nr:putative RNA polymerase I specific transcription initiation factor RRN3, armadillo-like helical [Lupinus albus]
MGKVLSEEIQNFPEMETDDFTDFQLIYHVREALSSVTSVDSDRENYDELVGYLHPKKYLTPHEIALLVTTLKALAGAASYIDSTHHEALLFAVSRMSLWNYGTDVMDALLELIISLAASNGKYIDWCLEMLVKNFVPPYFDLLKHENGLDKKNKVLSRVHAALKDIADLVPLAPLRLSPIVVQRMPSVFSKEPEIVVYVENMLRLESGAIGEIVSGTMLHALVDRLIELDVEIGWDGLLQEDARGMFEMELENDDDFEYNDEKYDNMTPSELLFRKSLQGNLVVEKLDSLMVLTFLHLESCQSSGRLAEVFNVLLGSFKRTILNAYKSKFTQFVMFYACALDPEECGVKFAKVLLEMFVCDVNPPITRMSAVAYLASFLSRAKFISAALVASILQSLVGWCIDYCNSHDFDMNPRAHQVFYSGCQAIMYILCFRLRSLMDIPRLKYQIQNMPIESILKHKLSPLKVCLPTIVEEFLTQAKAAQLFITAESFVFNDLLESDLSKSFGGMDRLDIFFPFDPCLLKKSESYIKPHFVRWSKVKTTYDSDDNDDFSDSGSDVSVNDVVESNADDIFDEDMMLNVVGFDFNRMSITPKNRPLKLTGMPALIRPSTSPE